MQIKQGDRYRKYTYEQVAQQVHCLANALIRQGLRPGDRVAIVAENRPKWVIAYLGILAAGGTTLLGGRFLCHAWPRAQGEGARSGDRLAIGIYLPWIIVLVSVGMTAWVVPLSTPLDRVSWSLSPTLFWESLWPIVAGISLAWLGWRVERKSPFFASLRIPPGDLLVLTDRLTTRTQECWRGISSMALLTWTPDLVSQCHRHWKTPWFSSILEQVEERLGHWMALGLVFLFLVAMFFALLTGAKLP